MISITQRTSDLHKLSATVYLSPASLSWCCSLYVISVSFFFESRGIYAQQCTSGVTTAVCFPFVSNPVVFAFDFFCVKLHGINYKQTASSDERANDG